MMKNILFMSVLAAAGCASCESGKTVRVSDYGFDEADSTRFLQAALDSGATKVVIDSRRWITLPLRVRSGQEIVFEDGAVVEAKKGAYLDVNDSVFNLLSVSNVTLCGKGEIRMHHDDYLKPPYKKAEWRHCVNILGCDNVRVSGLKLLQGGGDGVYVGALSQGRMRKWRVSTWRPWSSNIVLEDLYIDTHVRQGMSITSCKGLTADRCVFRNTWGLPPQAGVDLEPNGPENPIVGMVFRDCTFENNRGAGFEFALSHLEPGESEKYDCLFERCRFVKDNIVVHNTRPDHTQIGGSIVLRDCAFIDPRSMPLAVGMMPDRPFSCVIENCRIVDNGIETKIDDDWLVRNAPLLASGDRVPSVRTKVDFASLVVVDGEPGVAHKLHHFTFRNHVRFAVYADRGRMLTFRGGYASFGRFKPKKAPVLQPLVVEDISGAKVAEIPMPVFDRKNPLAFSFDAPKKGFYFIRAEMNRKGFVLAEADAPVAVDLTSDWQDVIGSTGTLSFHVPPTASRFGVFASGDGGECVAATVKDPTGKIVWENGCIAAWAGHVAEAGAASGLWTLTLAKPEKGDFEDERIDLVGVPGFFFLDPTRYWKAD